MAIEATPTEPGSHDSRRRAREMNSFLWLCGWGCITAAALAALAITSQTKTAGERLRHIFASNESMAIARMPPRIAQLESETQMLAAQIRVLNTERDRLSGRIALLESAIDDMTGAIKKQAAAIASPGASAIPATAGGSAIAPRPAPSDATEPHPVMTATPVTTIAITRPPGPDTAIPQPNPSLMTRVAATNADEPTAPTRNQGAFGLDLGGGTMEAVRQRWTTVKANFGPLLSGMHALAARDYRQGANGYRLVVGPLPNSATASALCTQFTAARTTCRAAKFDGDPILPQ